MVEAPRTRLRQGPSIVGYERETPLGPFYSTDGLWWYGTAIEHTERDAGSGLRDRNARYLFENDIVKVRWRHWFRRTLTMRIVRTPEGFVLQDLERDRSIDAASITADSRVEFLSHSWLNPHLDS